SNGATMTHNGRKLFSLWVMLFVCAGTAFGQQRTITGAGTDASTNTPRPGGNVAVRNSTIGTATDVGGRYSLSAPGPRAVLVFSFVGYQQQEIPVGDQQTISVTLREDIAVLGEVVAIGYGVQRREALTGSVSSVEIAEADIGLTSSPQELLQGRTAGVQVIR